jgi:hypothetical protein
MGYVILKCVGVNPRIGLKALVRGLRGFPFVTRVVFQGEFKVRIDGDLVGRCGFLMRFLVNKGYSTSLVSNDSSAKSKHCVCSPFF